LLFRSATCQKQPPVFSATVLARDFSLYPLEKAEPQQLQPDAASLKIQVKKQQKQPEI
jgi:hypothetical protein